MSIKEKSDAIGNRAVEILESGQFDSRTIAEVLELQQRSLEIYDEIQEICNNGLLDESVIIRAEGKNIKFKDIDHVAEFLRKRGVAVSL